MNVFNKVTLQSLKKNKTRTIVTIIGIILSAAMICAVTTFVSSMQNYALQYSIYNDGDWHGAFYDVTWQDYEEVNETGKLSNSTYGQLLGYSKVDSKNEYKPYMYVIGGEKDSFFDTLPVHLISGNLPKNSNEIILPEHLSSNGGLTYKVGDTVTLELGERTLDGYSMGQNNPCYTYDSETNEEVLNDEVIVVRETRTYTVVGIYERPGFEERTAPGYTALTIADTEWSDEAKFDMYFKMHRPAEVYDFMKSFNYGGTQNTDVLMFSGVSRYSSFSAVLMSLATIIMGLIMFGSIALIYNAFSISVSERTKQFGLLSSVGATKKQLRKMVLFEAFAVSAVGIPLGIGVGIAGIAVTLMLIGNKFTSLIGNIDLPMRVCVSWESVAIAVIVALFTVLLSAWFPSKRATSVSAVEAIRQNVDIKSKNKQVKTSKLTYLLFGLPGVLANKHYKRNKKKYRTTVISLFMSIVLFVSASAFCEYLTDSVEKGFGSHEYDLAFYVNDEESAGKTPNEILALLKGDKNVTQGAFARMRFFDGMSEKKYLTSEMLSSLDDRNPTAGAIGATIKEGNVRITGHVQFVDEDSFDALLKQYHLNRDDYYNTKNPLAIAIDQSTYFDVEKEKYVSTDVLKTDNAVIEVAQQKFPEEYRYSDEEIDAQGNRIVKLTDITTGEVLSKPFEEVYLTYSFSVGKTISDVPYYSPEPDGVDLTLIYPNSMLEHIYPQEEDTGYQYSFYLCSNNHAASYENLRTVLAENSLDSKYLSDYAAAVEEERNVIIIVQVFSYGFIVLISLIAAANVFNTISTNIALRRREFAMLKSVGMAQKDFNKMMNFECLLYGSKSLLYGLPASAGVTYLIYKAISDGFETSYHLPWTAIGIAVLSVFLVVFVTMMYSMSKIKKDNPIDALKNENL